MLVVALLGGVYVAGYIGLRAGDAYPLVEVLDPVTYSNLDAGDYGQLDAFGATKHVWIGYQA